MKKNLLSFLLIISGYAAFSNATVAQKEWRWRNDNGNEATATWVTSQDQAPTINACTSKDTIRLRMAFQVNPDPTAGPNPSVLQVPFQLAYSTSPSGPWTTINTTSTNDFMQATSPFVTDGTSTTQQLVHSASGSYAPGQFLDRTHTTANIVFMTSTGVTTLTEYEWVIVPTAAAQSQIYYFMLPGLSSYPNSYPSITYAGGPTAATQNIAACNSYESPSGTYTWTNSGTYNDTIPNMMGCDSVITTNLTIKHSSTGDTTAVACNSFSWYGSSYTVTSNQTHTLTNAVGCDSILTLHLTIKSSSTGDTTAAACNSFSWYGNTYTTTSNHTHILTNAVGCDSILTLHLTINNNAGDTTAVACNSFSWYGNTYTTSSNHTHTLTNAAGCDSVLTLHLTINTVDATTTVNNATISANNANGTYVWVDCNNSNAPIANETSQIFSPANNGSYAVIVTENGCSEMSACVSLTTVGISEAAALSFNVLPNPNNGNFTIEVASAVVVEVYNPVGQVLLSKTISAGRNNIELDNAANGIYFITLTDVKGNRSNRKIVVNK